MPTGPESRAAGELSSWVRDMRAALRGEADAAVPCAGCTACCESHQFVPIGPDEADTLAHIPPELLFPAPRLPPGHVLLPHDRHGRCPMLVDGRCSIYDHRPRTCRSYDCRVFAATGIEPEPEQRLIAERTRSWRFDRRTGSDAARDRALRAAAAFLTERADLLPDDRRPRNATQRAVLAVQIHDVFLDDGDPGPEAVRAAVDDLWPSRH